VKLSSTSTKPLYHDANITFRIHVKIIHFVAGQIDNPE